MRDQDCGPPLCQTGQLAEEFILGTGVDVGRRFIQNENRRLAGKGTGDGNLLPDTARGLVVAKLPAQKRIVALWHAGH